MPLPEAYLAVGERELAEVFYRKSLELDLGNRKAVEKLRALGLRQLGEEGVEAGRKRTNGDASGAG